MHIDLHDTDQQRDPFRLSPSVAIRLSGSQVAPTAELEQKQTAQFFSLGYREYYFLSLFADGSTLHQAVATMAQQKGKDAFSHESAGSFLSWAIDNKLLESCNPSQADRSEQPEGGAQLERRLGRLLWLRIPLGNPAPLIETVSKSIKPLAQPASFFAIIALFILSGWLLVERWQSFQAASSELWWPRNWWVLAVGWLMLKVVHEIGHGLAAHLCGARAEECGIIFLFLSPLAYIDVSAAWRIPSRTKRVLIGAAGMLAEWICAALAIILWAYLGHGWWMHQFVGLIWLATISTVAFNANPLMRFDGYYMLSDAIGKPNLYEDAQQAANRQLQWLFYGVYRTAHAKPSLWLLAYGYVCKLWRFAICIGLLIACSALAGGLGIAITLVAIAAWWLRPLQKSLETWTAYLESHPERALRSAVLVGSLAFASFASWLWVPNPFQVQAACLVQFRQETAIRAPEDGLVYEVLVQAGDQVSVGQPILRLENQELQSEVASLRVELAQHELAERVALHGFQSGDAEVARRRQKAVRKNLLQRESQLRELQVLAHRPGKIVARNIDQLVGTTVLQGQVLLNIVQNQDKELHVVVDADRFALQQHSNASTATESNQIRFRIGARGHSLARIKSVDVDAKTEVKHKVLTTGFGGRIPIRYTAERELRLPDSDASSALRYIQPQIHMSAKLNDIDSARILSGEVGYATLPSPHPTLGRFLFCSAQEWVQERIQRAWASEI